MAVMTKYLLDRLMDHVLRGIPYEPPKQVYLAFFRLVGDKMEEVTGPGYERQPVTFGKLFQGYLRNSAKIEFSVAQESWGEIAELGLMEKKGGPEMLFRGSMTLKKRIEKGDRAIINAGELVARVETVE